MQGLLFGLTAQFGPLNNGAWQKTPEQWHPSSS
jgi:hypothetical protein